MSNETEVKIYVTNLHAIEAQLQALGAQCTHERIYERNVRYDTVNGQLNNQRVVLRLREDNRVRLTYKEERRMDKGISTREELEVDVSDFETMEALLGKLGYQPYMFYEKYRTTYALDNVRIMLDELPFGNFIEVEGDFETIEAMLKKLSLQHHERREHSYTKLFDFVKHHLALNFRDLSFDNFHTIAVPESAFIPPGSIVIR